MSKTQESRYSRSLIEASLDPLFTISPEGKITDINNASVNITEVTRENLIGTNFFDYFTEPDKAREIYKQVFAHGFVADYPLTIRDGKLTDVLFNGSVYKDESGKVIGVVVVARDITDHNRIESELIQAKVHAELAMMVAEEAKSKAEEATQIAEDAVRSKQQFLSNMSHEIRTPMNAIIGFTKVLLKTDLSERQKEYLTAIKMSGDTLTVLINDILDLAKVDAGKMNFEKISFNLKVSLSTMIHLFEPKVLEKKLTLRLVYDENIPKYMIGDPVRLLQIIMNLISNSIKFTFKGGIKISVHLLKNIRKKATIEFTVSDTGIGIADDKIEHIFENFQQATNETSRLYGGTGLGLAIAKHLVESQGGTISVKSKVNAGSTFSFILPFKITNTVTDSEKGVLKVLDFFKNTKVLIVEDVPINQMLMKTLMDDYGFVYDVVSNGRQAIDMLKDKSYDIILMDLHMPDMNGFEATSYIRSTLKSTIPIIALTADVTTVDLKKCKAAGMDDYISKPLDENILYKKITNLVKDLPPKKRSSTKKHIQKIIDLTYLRNRTKTNTALMSEMIELFLEQTPSLINRIKTSLLEKDWDSLYTAIHKVIPSFAIMGINTKYEDIAKKIQEYAKKRQHTDELEKLFLKLESVCLCACKELEAEYILIKRA
jgi:PAS domain S-box-containing protein